MLHVFGQRRRPAKEPQSRRLAGVGAAAEIVGVGRRNRRGRPPAVSNAFWQPSHATWEEATLRRVCYVGAAAACGSCLGHSPLSIAQNLTEVSIAQKCPWPHRSTLPDDASESNHAGFSQPAIIMAHGFSIGLGLRLLAVARISSFQCDPTPAEAAGLGLSQDRSASDTADRDRSR